MGNVVEEVRALRAEVSRETHGFERMAEYLRTIRQEYLARSGRFAGLGLERSESVHRAIASAPDDESDSVMEEVRALREHESN